MTLATALQQGTRLLAEAGISAPRLTAEVLLCHALGRERSYLYAHSDRELRELEWIHYGRYLHERLNRKPTQYITGKQEFFGREFRVSPAVLIPRPETEHLVEAALEHAPAGRVFDVGTGSGILAITLALELRRPAVAIDLSREALDIAQSNAARFQAPVDFLQGDGLSAIAGRHAGLIVSNPPYVADSDRDALQPEVRDWEPSLALFAGPSGLDFYRRLVPEAERVLLPGGRLLVEIGAGQSSLVGSLFGSPWHDLRTIPDLAGIPRVVSGTFRGSAGNS